MNILKDIWDGLFHWWGRPNPNPNIGMVGDGDEVELLEDIERAFSVRFTDDEAEAIVTLGDLHEAIMTKTDRWSSGEVWAATTRLAAQHTFMPPENMEPKMQFFDRVYD